MTRHPALTASGLALAAALVLTLALCAACAGPLAQPADHADGQARSAVANLFAAYASGPMAGFADLVASDFAPGRDEFLTRVDSARQREQAVEFQFWVDQVLMRASAMAVSTTWTRKGQTASGQTMRQGQTEFVFHAEGGRWMLSQTRGDNPF